MIAMSLVNPLDSAQAATTPPTVSDRLFGQDRYQTSVAIAEAYNNDKCENIILASGNDFPDALSASVLSKKLNAPILLVDSKAAASSEPFNYINAHVSNTGTVYIIGGTVIIGTDFETKLYSMGYSIKRIGGTDRYDTDMLIVNDVNVPSGTPVFIASGENFPDALSVSSFSGSKQYPTLLVGQDTLPAEAENYIVKNKPTTIYIAGGMGAVSQNTQNKVQSLVPNTTIIRLAGNDRFDTVGVILTQFSTAPATIYLANGNNFPDTLAGSALAAKTGDPILLVDNQVLKIPPAIETYLKKLYSSGVHPNVIALGGTGVVPDRFVKQVENVLEGKPPIVYSKIVSGDNTAYYLDSSGHVWAWGKGNNGELGNGTTNNSTTPVQVSNLTNIVAISGRNNGYALDNSGNVWSWGSGYAGALGNGTNGVVIGKYSNGNPMYGAVTAVQVSNLMNIVAIAGGGYCGYALDSSGHVWTWGEDDYGRLGKGAVTYRGQTTPVQVSNLTNIVAIAGGALNGYALDSSGHVWVWGSGDNGELGNGTIGVDIGRGNNGSTTPVQVLNLTDIVAITSGFGSGYALDNSGKVWAWGSSYLGELGNGTTGGVLEKNISGNSNYGVTTPVQVSNISNIVAIASGDATCYALDSSGKVWAWGSSFFGELGNGTTNNSTTPVQVSNLTNIKDIAGGSNNGYALDSSGNVWAWGSGYAGGLGNGTNGVVIGKDSTGYPLYGAITPVQVLNIPKN